MAAVSLDSFQYTSDTNPHFRRMVERLRDRNIYDKQRIVEAFTTVPVIFAGAADPGLSVVVRHTFINPQTLEKGISDQVVTANELGRFQASFIVQRGENQINAFAEFDPSIKSQAVDVDFYNFLVFLRAYAEEFDILESEQKLIVADSFIASTRDQALRDNFGVFTRLERPSIFSKAQYRKIIEDVLRAYDLAPTEEALNIVVRAFTTKTPRIKIFHKNRAFRIGTELKLRASSLEYDPEDRLLYFFDGGPVFVNFRNFQIPSQIRIAPDNQKTFVFVDSDGVVKESVTEIFNSATQFLMGVITAQNGTIIDITGCSRLDDDAFTLDQGFLEMSFEMTVLNAGSLSDLQKVAMLEELSIVKAAHVTFFVIFDDGTQGVQV